jgi:hypothetical protein
MKRILRRRVDSLQSILFKSSPQKDIDSSKLAKLNNLATGNPEMFGNTTGQ